jgi:nucleoside-diphosphate-sugar epimerase
MIARALVTGATGMLGGYVVRRLLEDDWRVRALIRRPERAGDLRARGVELVPGDLTDQGSLCIAARGCRIIVHAAASIGAGSDSAGFHAANVTGTEHVVRAAEDAQARLVLVSSTAVFGQDRYRTKPTDESAPLPTLPDEDAYGRSKQDAEGVVIEAQRAGRVWASVVRPPVMYGVGDRQFAPRIGPVLQAGVFPLVDGGHARLSLVHADAVAEGAIRAALTEMADGRVYHLTDDFPVSVADLVRLASEGLGRRIRTPRVPLAAARIGFALLRRGLLAAGREDLARHAPGTLAMLTRDNPFTSGRARSELGWDPRVRPEEGIPEAFRWWRDRHLRGGGT